MWKMNDKTIKAINYLFHPQKLLIRIKWKVFSRKLKYVGKGTWVGKNFSIKGAEYISIKNDFIGGINLKLHAYDSHCGKHLNTIPQIIIGNNVTFTDGVYISSINKVEIEDGVLCGGNVFITDNFHGKSEVDELDIRPNDRLLYSKGAVHIGKNVWIGKNACIMPNVIIGDNCIVGANAVVTKNIPPNCVVAGVPAKIIREIK